MSPPVSTVISRETFDQILDANHYLVLLSCLVLSLEKLYIIVTKLPRAKYKGHVGAHLTRWIVYHWITVSAGVLFKYGVEHDPERLVRFFSYLPSVSGFIERSPLKVHLYLTVFLLAEAVIGVLVKGYIFWNRYRLKRKRTAKKMKNKKQ